jgi:hypothetical protein
MIVDKITVDEMSDDKMTRCHKKIKAKLLRNKSQIKTNIRIEVFRLKRTFSNEVFRVKFILKPLGRYSKNFLRYSYNRYEGRSALSTKDSV